MLKRRLGSKQKEKASSSTMGVMSIVSAIKACFREHALMLRPEFTALYGQLTRLVVLSQDNAPVMAVWILGLYYKQSLRLEGARSLEDFLSGRRDFTREAKEEKGLPQAFDVILIWVIAQQLGLRYCHALPAGCRADSTCTHGSEDSHGKRISTEEGHAEGRVLDLVCDRELQEMRRIEEKIRASDSRMCADELNCLRRNYIELQIWFLHLQPAATAEQRMRDVDKAVVGRASVDDACGGGRKALETMGPLFLSPISMDDRHEFECERRKHHSALARTGVRP